jgi:hypothetical protein
MNRNLFTIATLLLAAFTFESSAQTNGEDSNSEGRTPLKSFFQKLEIRQSFGSAATKKAPARFQVTLPKNEDDSYLIDAGIGVPVTEIRLGKHLLGEGKVVAEYHRNTLIDDEQHTWQAGFSSTFRTGIRRNSTGTRLSQLYFTPTAKYSRNLIDTANAFLFTVDFVPFRSGEKGLNLNTYTIRGNRKLIHLLSLIPGIEFQNNFSAKSSEDNGAILRPLFKAQYLLAGNKKRKPEIEMIFPEKTWEASVDYTIRYAVVNSTLSGEKFSDLLRTSVDYYFLTSPVSLSFGISFNYGSDPLQGLKKQQFYLATLSLQK